MEFRSRNSRLISSILILLLFPLGESQRLQFVNINLTQAVTSAPTRYVRGVYEVPQPPSSAPLLYDSYFPLIFEVVLPKWDINTMKIQFWKDHNNCTKSQEYDKGYPCPVMFHMNDIIEDFVGNMTLWQNLFLDQVPVPEEQDGMKDDTEKELNDTPLLYTNMYSNATSLMDQDYYCNKIAPHFASLQTTPEKLVEYYNLLDKCSYEMLRIPLNHNDTAHFLEELYHDTFSSYTSEYWNLLPQKVRESSVLSLWTTLETTLMLHQYMETEKYARAVESCQQNQIPWTLVNHNQLVSAIASADTVFEHQLAIPYTQMSKYFKLPLTDCVFVEKERLIVRILVPLRAHAKEPKPGSHTHPHAVHHDPHSYQMIKYEPVIFHKWDEFCWIDEIRGKRFVVDSAFPDNLYETECLDQEQKLCRIPVNHYSSHDAAEPCPQALHTNNEEDIIKHCHLKCEPMSRRLYTHRFFNFAHTTGDSFIYTLGADEDARLNLECEGSEPHKIEVLEHGGAYNITLPCGCEVEGGGVPMIDFEIAPPCQNELVIEKIMPYHWKTEIQKKVEGGIGGKLSAARSGDSVGMDNDVFISMLDQRYEGSVVHFVFLWLMILLLVVTVGGMAYVVLDLWKWKRQEVFRETRLIYSNMGENNFAGPNEFQMDRNLVNGQ